MTASSSSTSFPSHQALMQQTWSVSSENKARACQRLGELFGLSINATEQACFETAWDQCKKRNWTLLNLCQEELNHILNEQGRSLLQQAIRIGEIALAIDMIASGITIHARDSIGNTAMHYAVQAERLYLVSKLYEHISQDAQNFHGQTPLHFAAAGGQLDVLRTLIENGANLNITTQVPIDAMDSRASLSIGEFTLPNLTPLAFAAIRGDRGCVDLFLSENEKNPALNLDLKFGTIGNLAHLLITFHHSYLLEFVLKKYPERISPLLNERNPRGLTPFMLASYLGEIDVLIILKEYLRDLIHLEATDYYGRTALHHAVLGKQMKSIIFLHSVGADLKAFDDAGNTPLQLAEGPGDESESMRGYLLNLSKREAKSQHFLPNFVSDPPENLVFKGNDPTGFNYLGVIKALEIKGKMSGIKRVAGSSMAALISTLLAIGCSYEEIAALADITPFFSFFDSPIVHQHVSNIPIDSTYSTTVQRLLEIVKNHVRLGKDAFRHLAQEPSLCSGKTLLNWIEEQMWAKTGKHNCTFGELNELKRTSKRFKHLTIFTACFEDN